LAIERRGTNLASCGNAGRLVATAEPGIVIWLGAAVRAAAAGVPYCGTSIDNGRRLGATLRCHQRAAGNAPAGSAQAGVAACGMADRQ